MTMTPHPIAFADGRTLEVLVAGPEGAPLVVNLPGTPSGHDLAAGVLGAAERAGLRVASIARPGYAGSTRRPGRSVADVVPDVLAVVDALGADRFAVMGTSGGGPHALACGALAADRCVAVASISGVGPWAADGLDFLAGMGEGNEIEFGAALAGEAPLHELLVPWREEMVSAGAEGTFASMQSVCSRHVILIRLSPCGTASTGGSTTTWPSPGRGASRQPTYACRCSSGRASRTSWCRRSTAAGWRRGCRTAGRGCCPTTVTSHCW